MAIDIGREKGRQVIGYIDNGKLQIEEIHHFDNRTITIDKELHWDLDYLYEEIIAGLIKCWDFGKLPVLLGIDTWESDFVLLDQNNNPIWKPLANPSGQLDTVNQLRAIKEEHSECLEKADCLLFIADYLSFLLCGVRSCEYTNASTTLLVDTELGDWNAEIIKEYGFPHEIFIPLCPPGIMVSSLHRNIAEEIGYDCMVSRVEGNRKFPNQRIVSIAEKNENANQDDLVLVGSIITMMIRAHQFRNEEECYRCVCDYFDVDPERFL